MISPDVKRHFARAATLISEKPHIVTPIIVNALFLAVASHLPIEQIDAVTALRNAERVVPEPLAVTARCGFDDNINSRDPRPYRHHLLEITPPAGVQNGEISVTIAGSDTTAKAPFSLEEEKEKIEIPEYAKAYQNGVRTPVLDIHFTSGETYHVSLFSTGRIYAGSFEPLKDCKTP